ncbi:MAG: hypothetical protein GC150_15670 [Rhizobiales bacterium]|nr:hypothetical protein [Hyphomicrobiales bacterium]
MKAAAFIWGLAEATLFFVVPDVLVSAVAARGGPRPGLVAGLAAALGAALGGLIMWLLAHPGVGPGAGPVFSFLDDALPAISGTMIEGVRTAMAGDGWFAAMLAGAFSGTPYKLYATAAGETGLAPLLFVAVSVPARLLRFALVVALAAGFARIAGPRIGERSVLVVLALFWIGFYALFWSLMPN